MTKRSKKPQTVIIEKVIEEKGSAWNESTQEVARTDAQRVLESLVAEHTVDEVEEALNRQGFKGDSYGYLLKPLSKLAKKRRIAQVENENDI